MTRQTADRPAVAKRRTGSLIRVKDSTLPPSETGGFATGQTGHNRSFFPSQRGDLPCLPQRREQVNARFRGPLPDVGSCCGRRPLGPRGARRDDLDARAGEVPDVPAHLLRRELRVSKAYEYGEEGVVRPLVVTVHAPDALQQIVPAPDRGLALLRRYTRFDGGEKGSEARGEEGRSVGDVRRHPRVRRASSQTTAGGRARGLMGGSEKKQTAGGGGWCLPSLVRTEPGVERKKKKMGEKKRARGDAVPTAGSRREERGGEPRPPPLRRPHATHASRVTRSRPSFLPWAVPSLPTPSLTLAASFSCASLAALNL